MGDWNMTLKNLIIKNVFEFETSVSPLLPRPEHQLLILMYAVFLLG